MPSSNAPTGLNYGISLTGYATEVSEAWGKEQEFRFFEDLGAERDVASLQHGSLLRTSRGALIRTVREILTAEFGPGVRMIIRREKAMFFSNSLYLVVFYSNLPDLLDDEPVIAQNIGFEAIGLVDCVFAIHAKIRAAFPRHVVQGIPTVSWDLVVDGKHVSRNIEVDRPDRTFQEYYPWLEQDMYAYFDEYFTSDESVLILLGETGTGKTSFIRSLIWHTCATTRITYDEKLLSTDSLFYEFITDERSKLLVVEDADVLLSSREHQGNKIMARFLNITDGLIHTKKDKKIIFTANILEPHKIDSALMREGRCFDHRVFRRLSFNEACKAARVAEIPMPTEDRDYTLAELLKRKNRNRHPKVGFTT